MTEFPFDPKSLKRAMLEIGVARGDLLFCHSNVGFFGKLDRSVKKSDYFNMILDQIVECIGPTGTLVLPSYTYSAPEKKLFTLSESPKFVGAFAQHYVGSKYFIRTVDPNVSVLVLGKLASSLQHISGFSPYSSYGLFDFLHTKGVKIFNINLDAGSTLIHLYEKRHAVKYRFMKSFYSPINITGTQETVESQLYVADRSFNGSTANFSRFGRNASATGLYKTKSVGRGFVGMIKSSDTEKLVKMMLKDNAHSLIDRGQ